MVKNPGKGVSRGYRARSAGKHWNWKGGSVGYVALHEYIYRRYGRADHCERCGVHEVPKGKTRWFHWSRKKGTMSRRRKDWRQLCIRCHREYDGWQEKVKEKYLESRCWIRRKRDLSGKFTRNV